MSETQEAPSGFFEAEQAVLGGILYSIGSFERVAGYLKPSDFYFASRSHSDIFAAMQSLYDEGTEIDSTSVLGRLKEQGITDIYSHDPFVYLDQLWERAQRNGPEIEQKARAVRNAALKYRLDSTAQQIHQIARDEPNATIAIEKAIKLLTEMQMQIDEEDDLETLADIMSDFVQDLEQQKEGKIVNIPTGMDDLDALLGGGMQPEWFYLLGGLPGEGKTSALLNILYHLLMKHSEFHLVFFSLEMGKRDLARRLVSMDASIDSLDLRNKALNDWQWGKVVNSALKRLSSEKIAVSQMSKLSLSTIRHICEQHKRQHGLHAVFLDYMQLMQGDMDEKQYRNHVQEINDIARGLKVLARELEVSILACASLNRAQAQRQSPDPKLSDLREGGESDADVVMFIRQSRERAGYSIVNVEKNRNGPKGEVTLKFDARYTRFSNSDEGIQLEQDDEEEDAS